MSELASLQRAFASGLLGQGVPWLKARLYEVRVKEGRILIAVQTGSDDEILLAKDILSKAGGNDICATREPPQSLTSQTHLAVARLGFG